MDGIAMGRCVIEAARREALIEEHSPLLTWVPEAKRREFAYAVVRSIDAMLYVTRARLWEAIVFDRETSKPAGSSNPFGSREVMTAQRYVEGASNRLVRTYVVLKPWFAEISARKAAGWIAKAQAAARTVLDETRPGWDRPRVLNLSNISA